MNHFVVRQALAGVQRSRLELPNKRTAITLQMLKIIKAHLGTLASELQEVFWAACLVAFFSLLRSANRFKKPGTDNHHLKRCDVLIEDKMLLQNIRALKTNEFKRQNIGIPLPKLSSAESSLYPTKAVLLLLRSRIREDRSLFSYWHTGAVFEMTATLFNRLLQKVLKCGSTVR